MKFQSRLEAGKQLAGKIKGLWQPELVYGIAKGGVLVAEPIAEALSSKLLPVHVSKLPLPWNQEIAFGVVIHDGEVIMDEGFYRQMGLSYMDAQKIARTRLSEVRRSQQNVMHDENPPSPKDKEVLVVDDGMATGLTMLGAVTWLKNSGAKKIYVATPVATQSAIEMVKAKIDGFTGLFVSSNKVFSVSTYYSDFRQLGDRDVRECLKRNRDFLISQGQSDRL